MSEKSEIQSIKDRLGAVRSRARKRRGGVPPPAPSLPLRPARVHGIGQTKVPDRRSSGSGFTGGGPLDLERRLEGQVGLPGSELFTRYGNSAACADYPHRGDAADQHP
jgi:hypothetical protein